MYTMFYDNIIFKYFIIFNNIKYLDIYIFYKKFKEIFILIKTVLLKYLYLVFILPIDIFNIFKIVYIFKILDFIALYILILVT